MSLVAELVRASIATKTDRGVVHPVLIILTALLIVVLALIATGKLDLSLHLGDAANSTGTPTATATATPTPSS